MPNSQEYNITLHWRRGMDEDWDGWQYRVDNWLSGPYPTVRDALLDASDHIQENIDISTHLTKKE